MYRVILASKALDGVSKLDRSEPVAYKKAQSLLFELAEHPTTGTGHPEQLKGREVPTWSRRISKKHRLVYEIYDTQVVVLVISTYGHYEDQ